MIIGQCLYLCSPDVTSDLGLIDNVHIFSKPFNGQFPCGYDAAFGSTVAKDRTVCFSVSSPKDSDTIG